MSDLFRLFKISIRITSVPPGNAPEEVREKWVGLTLPVVCRNEERPKGWAVEWNDAMEMLRKKSFGAWLWWRQNVIPMTLIFTDDCCEIASSAPN
jgi:hypothetical protein